MVKDHSLAREETRCRHMGYSFQLAARVTLVMEYWLEREIAQWVHHEGLFRRFVLMLY